MQIIKESWKELWKHQEIRVLVLTSLFLQIFLVFLAPLRKRTSKKLLILILWFFYLFADYVAILALGNILKSQSDHVDSDHGHYLRAFWAPFLLLHLGGPDTITSYSIEDNELWWRHLLGLVVQVTVAFLVFLDILANTELRIPASLVFIVGFVKYAERTWALRSASMNQLRDSLVKDPDPGPNYAEFMEEYVWRREAGQTAYVKRKGEPPPPPPQLPSDTNVEGNAYDINQIVEAYDLFKRFKLLVVDLMLTFQERNDSQAYFWECSVPQAFEVVEMELSFLYDVLHTKAVHIRCLRGCLLRFASIGMVVVALLFFMYCDKQVCPPGTDATISYVLLGSALFMELTSLVIMMISDWMIVALKKHNFLNKLAVAIAKVMSWVFPKGKPRWSRSMSQYSLLSFSLGDRENIFTKILRAAKVKDFWDGIVFVQSTRVPSELKGLLFAEVKTKSKRAKHTSDFKELIDCKGEKVLRDERCNHLRWTIDKEFDESILLWHIATDLCFHSQINVKKSTYTGNVVLKLIRCLLSCFIKKDNTKRSNSEVSLILSNYMLYLLIMQPALMPAGIGRIRFKDTCAEAKEFFRAEKRMRRKKEEAAEALLDVETEVDPIEVKGDRSKSVLFDACRLAKELNLLEEDERWRLVSRLWVEMLGFAAINCKTFYHAKQLSQGGEFLTHVWLLMAHMGIGEQYRIEAGHAVATLAFDN